MNWIADYIKNEDYSTLVILVSILILTWLYQTIKSNLQNRKSSNEAFIDNSIKAHSKALMEINKINGDREDLLDSFYNLFVYADEELIDQINKYIISPTTKELKSIQKAILYKIKSLKQLQPYTSINLIDTPFVFESKLKQFKKYDLDTIFYPILYIICILTILLTILLLLVYPYYTLIITKNNYYSFFLYAFYLITSFFTIYSIQILVYNITKKNNLTKTYFKDIILLFLYSLSPIITLNIMSCTDNIVFRLITVILFAALVSLTLIKSMKISKKR